MKDDYAKQADLLATQKDLKRLDVKMDKGFKDAHDKVDKGFKDAHDKMDKGFKDADDRMHAMFEKFTTVILEAINDSVEKVKDETHLNTMRKIEVERDKYNVLFEIHNDHDTKIKSLDKRVLKLEEYA